MDQLGIKGVTHEAEIAFVFWYTPYKPLGTLVEK